MFYDTAILRAGLIWYTKCVDSTWSAKGAPCRARSPGAFPRLPLLVRPIGPYWQKALAWPCCWPRPSATTCPSSS